MIKSNRTKILISVLAFPLLLLLIILVNNLWYISNQIQNEGIHSITEKKHFTLKSLELSKELFYTQSLRSASDVNFVVPFFHNVNYQAHEYLAKVAKRENLLALVVINEQQKPVFTHTSATDFKEEIKFLTVPELLKQSVFFHEIEGQILLYSVVEIAFKQKRLGYLVSIKKFTLDRFFSESLLVRENQIQSAAMGSNALFTQFLNSKGQNLRQSPTTGNFYVTGEVSVTDSHGKEIGKIICGHDFRHLQGSLVKTTAILHSIFIPSLLCAFWLAVKIGNKFELTETKKLNSLVRQLNAALLEQVKATEAMKNALRLKDEFLANTSHELCTPLAGIIGLAEALAGGERGVLPEGAQKDLELIASSGRKLSYFVNDILDFSKLQRRDLELKRGPVCLRQTTQVVFAILAQQATEKRLTLENEIAADVPLVHADENRLLQILLNLVGNAVKFTAKGHVRVEAQAWHTKDNSCLKISVTDTGIGVAMEKCSKIFDAFEQGHSSSGREFGGIGLGLPLAKKLIELHHGEISIDKE
jgi:signal transduction histidine kinase